MGCPISSYIGVEMSLVLQRDSTLHCSGFYEVSRCGPFRIFTFQHEIPSTGPSQWFLDAVVRWPGRYEIREMGTRLKENEIFMFGDATDDAGRERLVLGFWDGNCDPRKRARSPAMDVQQTPVKAKRTAAAPNTQSPSIRGPEASRVPLPQASKMTVLMEKMAKAKAELSEEDFDRLYQATNRAIELCSLPRGSGLLRTDRIRPPAVSEHL